MSGTRAFSGFTSCRSDTTVSEGRESGFEESSGAATMDAGASGTDAALCDGRIRAKQFFFILDKILGAFLFVNSIDVVFVQFEMLPHDILDIRRSCHIFAADFLDHIQYLSLGVDTYI